MINKISDGFYCITLTMPFKLKYVNVYVLVHDKEIALFDSGINLSGCLAMLEKDLESIGLGVSSVKDIYITHAHVDHCGMAGVIKKKSGAAIHLSSAAAASSSNFLNEDLLALRMRKFYLTHGFTEQEVGDLIMIFRGMRHIVTEFKGDYCLKPGETRRFGRWQFEAIFTPGHSNGHICYYFPQEGFLLSGDTVLPQITPNLSPDFFDEQFRPLHSFLESLNVLEKISVEKIYPGHGSVFGDLPGRIAAMRGHHADRTRLIRNCLGAAPQTTYQVSQAIFGADLTDFDKFLALNETYVHLLELKIRGVIAEEFAGPHAVYRIL